MESTEPLVSKVRAPWIDEVRAPIESSLPPLLPLMTCLITRALISALRISWMSLCTRVPLSVNSAIVACELQSFARLHERHCLPHIYDCQVWVIARHTSDVLWEQLRISEFESDFMGAFIAPLVSVCEIFSWIETLLNFIRVLSRRKLVLSAS